MSTTTETTLEVLVALRGTYQPGCPEQGPTYSSGGQPAEPAGFDDVEATGLTVERPKSWDVLGARLFVPDARGGDHLTFDLLDGLDEASKAKVLDNVRRALGEVVCHEALMGEVDAYGGEDPDDARDRARDDAMDQPFPGDHLDEDTF